MEIANFFAKTKQCRLHNTTQKHIQKNTFLIILQTCFTSVPAICNMHVQKRWQSCFTFCLKTNLDAEELCLNWSTNSMHRLFSLHGYLMYKCKLLKFTKWLGRGKRGKGDKHTQAEFVFHIVLGRWPPVCSRTRV